MKLVSLYGFVTIVVELIIKVFLFVIVVGHYLGDKMNIPIDFDENGGEFRAQAVVPFDAPQEYKQYIYKKLQEEIGIKLYGLIEQSKTPVTIDILEKIID